MSSILTGDTPFYFCCSPCLLSSSFLSFSLLFLRIYIYIYIYIYIWPRSQNSCISAAWVQANIYIFYLLLHVVDNNKSCCDFYLENLILFSTCMFSLLNSINNTRKENMPYMPHFNFKRERTENIKIHFASKMNLGSGVFYSTH